MTSTWPGITGQVRQALALPLTFHRVTQEAMTTGLIDDEQVFDRVTLLLAVGIRSRSPSPRRALGDEIPLSPGLQGRNHVCSIL